MNRAVGVVGCIKEWVVRNPFEAKMCFHSSGFRYKLVLVQSVKLFW